MKKLLGLMLVLVFSVSALANPFSDVPFSHWAYDAVAKLSAKGIITGFPDGTFKGQRKVTRYELAMILARLMAKMDGGVSMPNMSADDKKTVEKLTVELADELSLLGVKVTALEDEVAVLKDDVAMMKEGGTAVAGDSRVKFGGSYNLYYYNTEDDNATITNNWYNNVYTELTFKPTKDVKFFMQNFHAFDWNGLAGNDYNVGVFGSDDRIKRVYLEMNNFDLLGLAQFNKATFGRKDFTLGNGLMVNARMTGIRFEADDYCLFHFTDGGSASSFANIWGIDYKVQDNMQFYIMEARKAANFLPTDKLTAYGLTYEEDMFNVEYVSAKADTTTPFGTAATDDSAAAYKLNIKATDDITVNYTVRESGMDQINNFAAPDNSILEEALSRFGNTKTMGLKYNVNPNFCLVYENAQEESGATAQDITAISLGYNKEVKPGVDMKLSYSMLTDDENAVAAVDGNLYDPSYAAGAAGTLAKNNDVNVLRMEMSVKF